MMPSIEAGLSSSESQSIRTGPFTVTQAPFIVGGSGAQSVPTSVATNWGLLAGIAAVIVLGLAALMLFKKRKGR